MNIKDFNVATAIKNKLCDLEYQHQLVASGKALGVTIQGTYQDDPFVDAMRPHVLGEIARRIESAKAQLGALGVTFSDVE